jgi:YidC/Oxa1 family membrane protein insertase
MNKNTIIGILLIGLVFVVYSIFTTPSKKEREALKHKQDSIARVYALRDSSAKAEEAEKIRQKAKQDSLAAIAREVVDTLSPEKIKEQFGRFSNSISGERKYYTVESDLMKVTISSQGGKIVRVQLKDYQTFDSLPLILFSEDNTIFNLKFNTLTRRTINDSIALEVNTDQLHFEPFFPGPGQDSIVVSGDDSVTFCMRLYPDKNDTAINREKYIEYAYTLKGNDFRLGFNINFRGMGDLIDKRTTSVNLIWNVDILKQERTVDRFNAPTIYYKFYQDEVDNLPESRDAEESLKTRVQWVSYKQHFFATTLIAGQYFLNADVKTFKREKPSPRYLRSMSSTIGLPYNTEEGYNIPMSFYFGPNRFSLLKKYDLDLERQIPIGWSFFLMQWINRYAVIPIFNFLGSLGWNYGIIILILTILLKIILFPLAYKSYLSSAKMRVLKPEIDELGKKFPKKEDAMKKQQATMALYKKAGVNPMAGCIPMLLQFPILIAMFRFFPSSFELRQQPFLWAHDLSSYDSVLNLPFTIPFYGDHVSLFTLLMTISTIIYTKINNDLMGSGSQQMPGMKTMTYIMPIMFLGIFNNYSSGLSYYYFLANVITFIQMFAFRRLVDEDKLHRQIEENKQKPRKKSSFQKRLEEMAKKRGYKPSKR